MTSWWIWNAIGLYPAIPGDDVLTIGAPRFSRVVLSLAGGRTLQVDAPGASRARPYVRSAALNGASLGRAWLRFTSIRHGGTLRLTTGRRAAKWADHVSDAPPSYP